MPPSGPSSLAPTAFEGEPWQQRFQALMPFLVRDILLVSSAYDAFVLEEDGSLSDRLFSQYSELSLSVVPRISHAVSGAEAIHLLERRSFDLVLTVVRLSDVDAETLCRRIDAIAPQVPIVLLIFDESDLAQLPRGVPRRIDRVFQWRGNTSVLIAAIKSVEDARNAPHDTLTARVRVVLVVEDRVRSYSSFLAVLYPLLLRQAGSLIAEGLNDFHRHLRMRARPKVLLATTYEEALGLARAYEPYLFALLTDIDLPRSRGDAPEHLGVELAEQIRERHPRLPVLFQTAETATEDAAALGAWVLPKHAPDHRSQLRRFFEEVLGFGDFIFRHPDRTEVGRARDVYEMETMLRTVPASSVRFHATHDHFSLWLIARSLFPLAEQILPARPDDFADVDALRAELIRLLRQAREREQEGVITDLSNRKTGPDGRFVRVGRGSLGGKGRSIAFMSTLIVRHRLLRRFEGLQIRIPKTLVLGTDLFDAFTEALDLRALIEEDDATITRAFLDAPFPEEARADLEHAFDSLRGPLAVRSSSLLEDARFQPFAGVYATYMLPNVDADPARRFDELQRAIKAVWASAFHGDARRYLAGSPFDADEQKMAVVVQQIVGQTFEDRFYPAIAGVAQSENPYAAAGQRPEDGVAFLCLGLGQTVVDGGTALRISPGAPASLPQFPSPGDFVDGSQRTFFALDLHHGAFDVAAPPEASLVSCPLEVAEQDGVLPLVGSVYSPSDDVLRENFALAGPRVVTFANVLKWRSPPVADALLEVLRLLRRSMGEEVELEFAVDLPVPGRSEAPPEPRLYLLQVRPDARPFLGLDEDLGAENARCLLRTDRALGHGLVEGLRHVVWARADHLGPRESHRLKKQVVTACAALREAGHPFVLVGPGRWGSHDATLGVGVRWSDIVGAAVIVETPIGRRRVEPSEGTHFFRNLTAARVAYLTVRDTDDSWLDREALGALGPDGDVVTIELPRPLTARVDGRRGTATLAFAEVDA